jgi:uncharacterized protein
MKLSLPRPLGSFAMGIRGRRLSEDLPLVIEIVDTEDKIKAFLPILDSMMPSGLVTLEMVQVLLYGEDVKHAPA